MLPRSAKDRPDDGRRRLLKAIPAGIAAGLVSPVVVAQAQTDSGSDLGFLAADFEAGDWVQAYQNMAWSEPLPSTNGVQLTVSGQVSEDFPESFVSLALYLVYPRDKGEPTRQTVWSYTRDQIVSQGAEVTLLHPLTGGELTLQLVGRRSQANGAEFHWTKQVHFSVNKASEHELLLREGHYFLPCRDGLTDIQWQQFGARAIESQALPVIYPLSDTAPLSFIQLQIRPVSDTSNVQEIS